ncbi:hypothetical protein B0H66DRAFT_532793 [Apodospora peruviana]|uniref:Uncharacterized protein n=1 Tax=Apodospora peruviana TaxID=516989 RepID=A0AAE0I4K5_9PEZI|nr:hypothetical protein B0H66DRAFT_532793 [Apodospora peruviana]
MTPQLENAPIPHSRTFPSAMNISSMPIYDENNQAPSISQSPREKRDNQYRTFLLESPPGSPEPELTVLPNRGGLEIMSPTLDNTTTQDRGDIDTYEHPHVRSTSSSYPSEGVRSPDLTVSPPMTFGRRILSNLSDYDAIRLAFMQSSESSSQPLGSGAGEMRVEPDGNTPRLEVGNEHIWDSLAVKRDGDGADGAAHHEKEKTDIDPSIEDADGSFGELATDPAVSGGIDDVHDNEGQDRPSSSVVRLCRSSTGTSNANLSTECLPRVSINPEAQPSLESSSHGSQLDHCSETGPTHSSSPRTGLRGRIRNYFRLHQTLRVKKWITRKFRAGRKGPRVMVRKVKDRKAKPGNSKAKGKRQSTVRVKGRGSGRGKLGRPLSARVSMEETNRDGNGKSGASFAQSIRMLGHNFSVTLFGFASPATATGEGNRGTGAGNHEQQMGHGDNGTGAAVSEDV